jgi:hypothetical protein
MKLLYRKNTKLIADCKIFMQNQPANIALQQGIIYKVKEESAANTTNVVCRMPRLCYFAVLLFAVPLHCQSGQRR